MSDQLSQYQQQPQGDDEITLKDIFRTIGGLFGSWPYLLGGAILGLGIAFIVNRYSQNEFEMKSSIAIEDVENPLASNASPLSLSFNWRSSGKVEKRIALLESYAHNLKVARSIGWETKHFIEGRLNRREEYKPEYYYRVEFDPSHPQLLGMEFKLEFNAEGFTMLNEWQYPLSVYNFELDEKVEFDFGEVDFDGFVADYGFGEWIETPAFRFRILKGKTFDKVIAEENLTTSSFQFQSYTQVAEWGMFTIVPSYDEDNGSLVTVSGKGPIKEQLVDYINASIGELQRYELRQKNLMSINTIDFIDGQLISIESNLRNSEAALEEFRANNLIVDLSSESEQMLEYFISLEQERASLNLQRSFYKYVLDFLQSKQNYSGLSLPTLSNFNDPLVQQLAEQLVESSVALERFNYSLEVINPAVIELEKEVAYTKQALYNATQNALSSSNIVLDDINGRIQEAQGKISRLPATEQQLINIQREYEISGSQYEMLLIKRAEAGILRASNLPDTQIIEPAKDYGQRPIGPNRLLNYLIGLLAGFILPAGFILLVNAFNTKVRSRQDIEKVTRIPLAGIAPHSKYESNLVVLNKPKSSVSEAFRALRSNLKFIAEKPADGTGQVLAITSSIGGEGKTFVAINLASVLSLGTDKVCLVGVDLRKPKIFNDFGLSNDIGLSNYLAGQNEQKEIIQKTAYSNLDVISGGVVPPNPSELIQTERSKPC